MTPQPSGYDKSLVTEAIVEAALRLLAQGRSPGRCFALFVFGELVNRRPDVIAHIQLYQFGDPYQLVSALLRSQRRRLMAHSPGGPES